MTDCVQLIGAADVKLLSCAGRRHVRINLSEQTDMMDLLGADLPVEGGAPGQFAWCDGPLLAALKAGDWILLDELNLAGEMIWRHPQPSVFTL